MKHKVTESHECPLRNSGIDPATCGAIDGLHCSFDGFPSQCPLLDDSVTIIRDKHRGCACISYHERTGEHVEDCPCYENNN